MFVNSSLVGTILSDSFTEQKRAFERLIDRSKTRLYVCFFKNAKRNAFCLDRQEAFLCCERLTKSTDFEVRKVICTDIHFDKPEFVYGALQGLPYVIESIFTLFILFFRSLTWLFCNDVECELILLKTILSQQIINKAETRPC